MATIGFSTFDAYSVPQRHCFHDSDEEEEGEEREYIYFSQPSRSTDANSSTKLLIVCSSDVAVGFVKSHVILKPRPYSVITCVDPVLVLKDCYFRSDCKSDKTANREEARTTIGELYEVEGRDDVRICLNLETLKDDYCNEWSRKLLDYCRPQTVVILHSAFSFHQYYFTDEERDEMADDCQFMRSLQTLSWSLEPLAPLLSCNNKISGEPAAVIAHCQVSSLSASLVNLYTSSIFTAKEKVHALRILLSHPILCSLPSVPFELADEKLSSSLISKPQSDMEMLYT